MQDLATNRLHHDGAILNEPEAKAIFGNIADLVKVHQQYLDYLEKTLKNWENDAITVYQLVISVSICVKSTVIIKSVNVSSQTNQNK